MIRRKDEIRVREVKNAQGGENTVFFHDWMLPEEDAKGHGRVISKLVIPPGASIGYHDHQGEFEALYVIEGEATVDDNGTMAVLKEGDMILCKDGCGHSTANKTERPLVLMALILNTLK